MKLQVIKVSQRGYLEKLGTSALTIDRAGCYLACTTMVENYYGFKVGILELNTLFIEKGVYWDRNLIDLFKIDKVNEFVKGKEFINCLTTTAPLNKIDAELTEGRPVIAQVDLNPNQPGPDHFILIIGKTEDSRYLCYDPWFKDEDAIFFDARYGDPAHGILGLRLISGPVPQPDAPEPSVADLEGQIAQYKNHLDDIKEHLRPMVMPGDDFPAIIGAIDELKEKARLYDEIHKKESEKLPVGEEPSEEVAWEFKILNLTIRFLIPKEVKKV